MYKYPAEALAVLCSRHALNVACTIKEESGPDDERKDRSHIMHHHSA